MTGPALFPFDRASRPAFLMHLPCAESQLSKSVSNPLHDKI